MLNIYLITEAKVTLVNSDGILLAQREGKLYKVAGLTAPNSNPNYMEQSGL